MTKEERKASEKRKREKTGIPKMPRVKPRTFESGFGIIIPKLPKDQATEMFDQLMAEMEDRKKLGHEIYEPELIPANKLQIVMSPEERKIHNDNYRDSYRNLDRVKLKRLEDSSKPSTKLKRKHYNAQKEVKERKKQLAKRRRAILKFVKKQDREKYNEAEKAADALLALKAASSVTNVVGAASTVSA